MVGIGDLYGDFKTLCKQWFYEKSEVDTALNNKQNSLVSGTNIKTINGESILGGGNITIQGGSGSNNLEIVDFYYDETNDEYVIETGASNIGSILDKVYPVGSIYMSVNSTSPQTLFGGTWEQIQDKFLLASGTSYRNGATGGSATVSLTKAQMPRHTHTQDGHSHGMAHNHNHHHMIFEGNAWSNGSGKVSAYTKQSNRSAYQGYTSYDNTASSKSNTDSNTATNQYTGGTDTTETEQDGSAHENMPPYLAVNVWKRTA